MSEPLQARKTGSVVSKSTARKYAPLGLLLAGLIAAYLFGLHNYLSLTYLSQQRDMLAGMVAAHPFVSPALFFAAYVAAVAFSLPAASILTIFGGFLFGWLAGGLLVVFAATIGATILFLAARSSFGQALRSKLGDKAAAFADGLRDDAFNYLLVLRLAPIFPFFVVNVAPALFNVKTRDYVLATFLGIIPGTFAYAWLGEGVGSILDAAKASGIEPSVKDLVTPEITFAFLALAIVAAMPLVVRKLRK
jgi:uncharacterized membrane protein YdjX (TVP38/TMEM64 family)